MLQLEVLAERQRALTHYLQTVAICINIDEFYINDDGLMMMDFELKKDGLCI